MCISFRCMAGPIQVGTFSGLATSLTVCSSTKPFSVCLHTDATEAYETDEALTEVNGLIGTRGFEMRKFNKFNQKYLINAKNKPAHTYP